MLTHQDAQARALYAVYIRPEGERGTLSFFPDEATATAQAGPGMPPGVITHGDTYVEHVGNVLLFAPADWPLVDVDQDLLVELDTGETTVFVALTAAESQALLALAGLQPADAPASIPVEEPTDVIPAPESLTGDTPAAIWLPDGTLVAFANGFDQGGVELDTKVARGDFDDEVRGDQAVVALLDHGHLPNSDDEFTWREEGDTWVINTEPRIVDDSEQFLCRYTTEDQTLVVGRSAADTDGDEHHLQLVATSIGPDFIDLGRALVVAGWRIDDHSQAAAELSANPQLRQRPGWYPAEAEDDESTPTNPEAVSEWIAVVTRY